MLSILKKRTIVLMFGIWLFNTMLISQCLAMDTGFLTDDIAAEDIELIFNKIELTAIVQPDTFSGFSCFAVNEYGDYALGFDQNEIDTVLVYSADGTFRYGFTFSNSGSLGLELDQENVILYFVRSDLAVSVDQNGNCLDAKIIQNTSQNQDYWNGEVFANKRTVNDSVFTAKHWLFNNEHLHWGKYTRLVKLLPDGEEIILYDATATLLRNVRRIMVLGGTILLLGTILFFRWRNRNRTD